MRKIWTILCLIAFGTAMPALAQEGSTAAVMEQALPGTGLGDLMPSVWRLAGSLVLVLGLVWVTMWIARRVLKGRFPAGRVADIRVLDRVHLAPRRSIELVAVKDRILVLGVTDHSISMLTELTQEEYPEADPAPAPGPKSGATAAAPRDFWGETRRLLRGGLRMLRQVGRQEPASAGSAGKV
jgi:flagellar protein FliO/FliZ